MRTTPRRIHRTHFATAFALLALCLLVPAAARAQWTQPDSNNNINNTNTGNVGVGTSAPNFRFEVQGAASRNTVAAIGDGDSVGYAGFRIQARTTTNIAENRTSTFNLHMRKDGWYSGDTSGPSFIIETGSKTGGFAAPFMITPINDVILNGGRGAAGLSYGRVGVGTTTPAASLHVNSQYSQGFVRVSGYGAGAMNFYDSAALPDQKLYQWRSEGGLFRMALVNDAENAFVRQNILVANSAGNVGIGTPTPFQSFAGVMSFAGGGLHLKGNAVERVGIEGGSVAVLNLGVSGAAADRKLTAIFANGEGKIGFLGTSDAGVDRPPAMTVDTYGGSVGVGTSAPGYRLDVQGGAVNASGGLCIAGVCKANWSEVGGGASQWATSGTSVYYDSGNVGVGTSNPGARLDVNGGINVGNPGGGGPLGNGSLLSFTTGGADTTAIQENWGLNLGGSAVQPVKVHNASLLVGYQGAGTNYGTGHLLVSGSVGVGTSAPPASKLHVAGDVTVDGNITAKFQDVAEWVPSVQRLRAGTVVVLDAGRTNHVLASGREYDTSVAGVVSARPGLVLGEGGEGKVMVATTGRVKVKVDATREPVRVGDLLVTSGAEGVAMKSVPVELGGVAIHRPGTIIGKALEPLAGGVGEILVLLSLQ